MHLADWIGANRVGDEMLWKGAAQREYEEFFRFAEALGGEPTVVSTHRSKSIDLPVIHVATPYGVRATVRDNFHDVKVSVWTPRPCDNDLYGLTAGGDSYLHPVYFEGFQESWIHPPFVQGADRFSVCTGQKGLILLAHVLRFVFEPGRETPHPDARDWVESEVRARKAAEADGFPVLFRPSTTAITFRFFTTESDVRPDVTRLHEALMREGPSPYDGKVSDHPLPYVRLDFSAGMPKPVDAWLRAIDEAALSRRSDQLVDRFGKKGASVQINRLTPALRARAEELGLRNVLRSDKD